jgi:hypothetical protein
MKTYKKILTGFIVISMVMLAIGASGLLSSGNDNQNPAAADVNSNNLLAATSVSWYSQNSTELPAPGSHGIPLYVTFVPSATITDANISINLTAYKSPLSYTYIGGPDKKVRTYNEMPEIQAGKSYTIMQMVNVSKHSSSSFYDENLTYGNATISGNTAFIIPVGKPQPGLISYTTNPPEIYQNEKFIKFTLYTENTGTSGMKNVNINVTSRYYKIVTPINYSLAYYSQGKLLNFTFYMDARNLTGNAPLYLHMGNSTYNITTYIHGNGKNSLSVEVQKEALISDTTKQLMVFYLNNTGNTTYRDIEIHMFSPGIISIHISSSNPLSALTADNITFARIKPGQSITVTYVIDTSNVVSGTYPVQLLVQYHFNNTSETFNKVYTYNQKIVPTTTQQMADTLKEPLYAGMAALIAIISGSILAVSIHSKRKGRKLKESNGTKNHENIKKDSERKP